MSLLNVLLLNDRALVGVDTRFLSLQGKGFFEGTKILHLPEANVLFASRGERTFLHWIFNWFLSANETMDLDAMAAILLRVVETQFGDYLERAKSAGQQVENLEKVEIVMVGWSAQHRKMAGVSVSQDDERQGFKSLWMDTGHIAPEISEDLSAITVPDHKAYLVEVAKAQVRQEKVAHPFYPIGGRLIIAEITKDRMTIESVAELNGIGQ